MKRFCAAAVLLLLGSPCYAGESYSFYVGGHRIHIETSRYCRSTSCVSLSIRGVYEKRGRRDYYDDYDYDEHYDRRDHDQRYKDNKRDTPARAPVAASPPAPAASPPPAPPPAPPVARAPLPVPAGPATPIAPPASVQPQPQIQPPPVRPMTTAAVPSPPPAVAAPAIASPAPPPPAPPPSPAIAPSADDTALPMAPVTQTRPAPRVSTRLVHRVEEVPDGPLGDWETEGHKGVVRIEPCGQALCGYVLDPSTDAKREAVLIDMKSNAALEWSGSIYSRDSGDTYYATVTLNEPNTLQVEACVLWRFWCSRNAWNRILKPGRMVNYRQTSREPRS